MNNAAGAKVPNNEKNNWQSIDIFLFSNGQQYSPPRKYHLQSEELNWWDATLNELARSHYGLQHPIIYLYTTDGRKIEGPLELRDGNAYVAVEPPDAFIDTGYEKYLIRASRSWEKRQAKKACPVDITETQHAACEHNQPCCLCPEKECVLKVESEHSELVTTEIAGYRAPDENLMDAVLARVTGSWLVGEYEPRMGECRAIPDEYGQRSDDPRTGYNGTLINGPGTRSGLNDTRISNRMFRPVDGGRRPNEFPPNAGKHPPRAGEHPPRPGAHPTRSGEHPPRAGEHPPRAGEHSTRSGEHPPRAGEYPPRTNDYPPKAAENSPRAGQHPPRAGEYPPRAIERPSKAGEHVPRAGEHGNRFGEYVNRAVEHGRRPDEQEGFGGEYGGQEGGYERRSDHRQRAGKHESITGEHGGEEDEYDDSSDEYRNQPGEHEGSERRCRSYEHEVRSGEHGGRTDNHRGKSGEQAATLDEYEGGPADYGGKSHEYQGRPGEKGGESRTGKLGERANGPSEESRRGGENEGIARENGNTSGGYGYEHEGATSDYSRKGEYGSTASQYAGKYIEYGIRADEHRGRPNDHSDKSGEREGKQYVHEGRPGEHGMRSDVYDAPLSDHTRTTGEHAVKADEHGVKGGEHGLRSNEQEGVMNGRCNRGPEYECRPREHEGTEGEHGVRDGEYGRKAGEREGLSTERGGKGVEHRTKVGEYGNRVGHGPKLSSASAGGALSYISEAQQHVRRSSITTSKPLGENKKRLSAGQHPTFKKPTPAPMSSGVQKKPDEKRTIRNSKDILAKRLAVKSPARISNGATATQVVGKPKVIPKYPGKRLTPPALPPPTANFDETVVKRTSTSLTKITSTHKSLATDSMPVDDMISDKEIIVVSTNIHRHPESEITSVRLDTAGGKPLLEGRDPSDETQTHISIHQSVLSIPVNEAVQTYTEQFTNEIKSNGPVGSSRHLTQSNSKIRVTRSASGQRNVIAADDTVDENYIAIINKGDVVNLKLNIEVRNGERTFNEIHKTIRRSRSLTNITRTDKGSQISIDEETFFQSKSLQSLLKNECFRGTGFEGRPKVVVVQCACCGQKNNPARFDPPPYNDNKKYFVMMPSSQTEDNEDRCDCDFPTRQPCGKRPQQIKTQNIDPPIRKTCSNSSTTSVTVRETVFPFPRRDIGMFVATTNSTCQTDNCRNEYAMVKTVNVTADQMLPPTRCDFPMRSSSQISVTQTEYVVSKNSCPKGPPNFNDSYSQTEWCSVLLEARRHDDGRYSFHLPPLHVLRYYTL